MNQSRREVCCALVLFVAMQTPADQIRDYAAQMKALADKILALVPGTPAAPTVLKVAAGGNLQVAIDAAVPGTTIRATPGTYGPVVLRKKEGASAGKVITIQPDLDDAELPPTAPRRSAVALDPWADKFVTIQARPNEYGLTTDPGAAYWRLFAVRFTSPGPDGTMVGIGDATPMPSVLEDLPHDIVLDTVLCDGGDAAKRGVSLNGNSLSVVNSIVRGVRQESLNNDTQAITSYNGAGPYLIDGNYLSAAGEDVLFGGADPKIQGMVGSDIVITRNVITKDLAWQAVKSQVKNLLELKNARRVTIEQNVLLYTWADAQDGTAVLFTVRNQEGGCPWCTVEDVTFRHNVVAHAASGVKILGHDDGDGKVASPVSGRGARIVVTDNLWFDLGAARWATKPGATARETTFAMSINDGIVDSEFSSNSFSGTYGSLLVLSPGKTKTPSANLRVVNNAASEGNYGVKGDGLAPGAGSWVPSLVDVNSVFDANLLARTATDNYKYPGNNVKSAQGEAIFDPVLALLPKFARAGLGASLAAIPSVP